MCGDLVRHASGGDGLLDLLAVGSTAVLVAELLLDRPQLLAQQHLALPLLQRVLGLGADVARETQHAEAIAQQLQHEVEPRDEIDRLQHLLLLGSADVHRAGDEVGQMTGRGDRVDGLGQLARCLRQKLDRLQCPLLQQHEPGIDIRCVQVGLGQALGSRGEERKSTDELEDSKSLLALADDVVGAVRCRHVTQDRPGRAETVQVDGYRIVLARFPLQHDADRPLGANGGLRGRDRARPAHREREDGLRKQHEVAHRHDGQHVVGQGPGHVRADVAHAGSTGGLGIVHGCSRASAQLAQGQRQATVDQVAPVQSKSALWQADPSLEPAMGLLEAVDHTVLRGERQRPRASDDDHVVIEHHLDPVRGHAR